jgi:hypothetical protein
MKNYFEEVNANPNMDTFKDYRHVILRWCKSLRSGQYHQIDGTLKGLFEENQESCGFCCLGVFVEFFELSELEPVVPMKNCEGYFDEGPPDVYIQLRRILGSHVVDFGMGMNDTGYTFNDIADSLEYWVNDISPWGIHTMPKNLKRGAGEV